MNEAVLSSDRLSTSFRFNGHNNIARPRRFGKTLNMSMLEKFFSLKYANS